MQKAGSRRRQLLMQYYTHIELLRESPTHTCVHRVNLDEATEGTFVKRVYNTMELLNIENVAVSQIEFSNAQIWNVSNEILCDSFDCGRKRDVGANALRAMFVEHQEIFHGQALHLYTDGSKSGGEVECAAVSQMHSISHKLSEHASIFTAALIAIVDSLNIVHNCHHRNFIIFCD